MLGNANGRHYKTASSLTIFCAASLIIGGILDWVISKEGGPEALGSIIPLMAIGGVHLLCMPIAMFHAYKQHRYLKNIYVYLYFLVFVVLTFWVSGPEVVVYILLLTLLTVVPILFSLFISYVRKRR